MVKIFSPEENLTGISGGLDSSLLAPSQAAIQSADQSIQRSDRLIQAQSSILDSSARLEQVKQRDRDNYIRGVQQIQAENQRARVEAARRNDQISRETKSAEQSIEYGKYVSDAMLQMTSLIEKRKSMTYDRDGKPTYESLPTDIESISKKIISHNSSKIADKSVKDKFELTMLNHATNEIVRSYSDARNQKISYLKSELDNTMIKMSEVAIRSPDTNIQSVWNQTDYIFDEARKAGLDADYVGDKQRAFRSAVAIGQLNTIGSVDPKSLQTLMQSKTPEELGLTSREYLQISLENKKAIDNIESNAYTNVELDIKAGNIKSGDVLQDKISSLEPANQQKLISLFNQQTQKEVQSFQEIQQLNDRLKVNKTLNLTDSSLANKSYLEDVKAIQTQGQGPISIVRKAQLAGRYVGTSVADFTGEVEGLLKLGNISQKKQAVQAFEVARSLNPQVVSTISQGALAEIGLIEQTIKYANLSDSELEKFLDKHRQLDPTLKANLSSQFTAEVDLEILNSSLQDYLDTDGYFDSAAEVDPEAINEYFSSVRNFYLINGGNYDAAASSGFKSLRQSLDVSNIGGVERIMLRPPEKNDAYAKYGVNAKFVIEKTLENTIKTESNLESIDLSNIRLKEIPGTEQDGMYIITSIDDTGSPAYVTDKYGAFIYYKPTQEELNAALAELGK